ncbi:unnamed protein product [Caenorhabditis angaria]|uniref:Protein quiver n=1 Tax=Caenorhabditis angaria TaxID=860376 RepID=A0A9P1MSR2_9PELO|nr:unnamed protein product [Caenorhabditis angaria]
MFLIFYSLTLLVSYSYSNQCHICDSFSGYCEFDGNVCVGPKCSRRFAPTSSGLIREQRLCVPSDSVVGCHKAILWDGMEGTECICEEHMCNSGITFGTKLIISTFFFHFLF